MAQQNNGIDETDKKFIKIILICLAIPVVFSIIAIVGLLIFVKADQICHDIGEKNAQRKLNTFVEDNRDELTEICIDYIDRLYVYAEERNTTPRDLSYMVYIDGVRNPRKQMIVRFSEDDEKCLAKIVEIIERTV